MVEYRAQWVVYGNFQKQGVDYEQKHTPVACEAAIKLIMTAIAMYGLVWEQFDIITAYLNTRLKANNIFMRQPTGFEIGDDVCHLILALYGLQQSAYLWHEVFATELKQLGF